MELATAVLRQCRHDYILECRDMGKLFIQLGNEDTDIGGNSLCLVGGHNVTFFPYLYECLQVGETAPSIASNRYIYNSDATSMNGRESLPAHLLSVPALILLNETLERMVDTCDAINDAFTVQQHEKVQYIQALNDFESKNQEIMDAIENDGRLPSEKEEVKLERCKETMRVTGDNYSSATTRLQRDYKDVRDTEPVELFRGVYFLAQHEADVSWRKLVAWEEVLVQLQQMEADWNESLSSMFPTAIFSTSSSYHGSFRPVDGDDDDTSVSKVTHIMI
jgi:hypothetical protein